MADKLTNQAKKELAKMLYLKGGITVQKELAVRVDVNPNTIGRWIAEEGWEKLRKPLLLTREEQLQNLYTELENLQEYIKGKKEGQQFADSKEADVRRKLIKDIKDLETKASIVEMIETFKRITEWMKRQDVEEAKKLVEIFDRFIKDSLK